MKINDFCYSDYLENILKCPFLYPIKHNCAVT